MAILESSATNAVDLLKQIVTFLTEEENFGAGNAWQLLRPSVLADIKDIDSSEVILCGVGDGQDKIFVGMKLANSSATQGQIDIVLNGFTGYDANLSWLEQPGAIPHATLPTLPLAGNIKTSFWLSATTYRFVVVVQLSTQYESAYLGFLTTVGVERQYPYPLAIGGSYIEGKSWLSTSPGHSAFMNPGSDSFGGIGGFGVIPPQLTANENTSSLRIRRPDGVWRTAVNKNSSDQTMHFERLTVWPYNTEPTNVLTVLDSSLTIENVIEFPVMLCEHYPDGIGGQFKGVYFIGNREDLSAKDTIIHDNKPYRVFNNVGRRDNDEYFAIEWF